jgi:hypothetical protein
MDIVYDELHQIFHNYHWSDCIHHHLTFQFNDHTEAIYLVKVCIRKRIPSAIIKWNNYYHCSTDVSPSVRPHPETYFGLSVHGHSGVLWAVTCMAGMTNSKCTRNSWPILFWKSYFENSFCTHSLNPARSSECC